MNEFGLNLIWLALQITVLCVIAVPVYLLARRNSPSGGATATFSVLMLVALLSAAAISPWPQWTFNEQRADASYDGLPSPSGSSAAVDSTDSEVHRTEDGRLSTTAVTLGERLQFFREAFAHQLAASPVTADAGLNFAGWLAVAFSVGAGIALIRLVAGLTAVAAQRQRSQPVNDRDLVELLEVLCAEFQCRRSVELRESDEIVSAATIGWRQPIILLPPQWAAWADTERRSVLAHEIAHISQNDFLCWLCAQLGLLLHFYHPLVHWLANRLRLEQELAADALAAEHSGGARPYLKTLAELALRQEDRPIAWPARTFLPTKGTLTRRVEMLRDSGFKPLSAMASRWRRGLVVCTLLGATAVLSGLRPPTDFSPITTAIAQDDAAPDESAPNAAGPAAADGGGQDTTDSTATTEKFSLKYVPPNAAVVFGARPSAVAGQPMFKPMLPMIEQGLAQSAPGVKLSDYAQVLFTAFGTGDNPNPMAGQPVMIVTHHDASAVANTVKLVAGGAELDDAVHGGKKVKVSVRGTMIYQPDETTVIYGPEERVGFLIDSTKFGVGMPLWHREFEAVADEQIVYLVDMTIARPYINKLMTGGERPVNAPAPPSPSPIGMAQAFSPLWKDTRVVAGGITFDQTSSVSLIAWCDGDEAAERVEATAQSMVPLAKNMLNAAKETMKSAPPEAQGPMSMMLSFTDDLLNATKVERDGEKVSASTESEAGAVPVLIGLMLPAIQSARMAARRAQSSNNVKQIMLAFHNYHAVNGHFPASAVTGPDGETKHSWRVALLPYLEEKTLYEQYKLDEPWNSEANLEVLKHMPQVFQYPGTSNDSTNTSYLGFVGEDTGLGDGEESVRIRDIRDGTSNTIMVVVSQQQIPWTKPEDLKYSPDEDLPKLGFEPNSFTAGLADGAALSISRNAEKTIRAMITRSGGEDLRQLPPARPQPGGPGVVPKDAPIRQRPQN